MTDKLHCPYCGEELSNDFGVIFCYNEACKIHGCELNEQVIHDIIDGKKAQDALKTLSDKILAIDIVSRCEGYSIYIDNYRVAGNKPWGGGTCLGTLHCRGKDLIYGIPELRIASITKQEN